MRFKLHMDGEVREVAAGSAGEIKVDGGETTAKVATPAADRRVVEVNGKSYDFRVVDSHVDSGEFLLELAGELIVVKAGDVAREVASAKKSVTAPASAEDDPRTAPASESRAAAAAEEVTNGVWAPMPGKIAKVLVKAGQDVKEGDPVVVLEAMKMENELRSPSAGTVGSVLVAEGDQAEAGQLLIAFV
jgi:glutaconyl-CoA/methylmalonyl-CoA decarboxylase subunit gamma